MSGKQLFSKLGGVALVRCLVTGFDHPVKLPWWSEQSHEMIKTRCMLFILISVTLVLRSFCESLTDFFSEHE